MGITITYNFNAGVRSPEEIREIIGELHQFAQDLPFEELDDQLIELTGEDCLSKTDGTDIDPLLVLKISATRRDLHPKMVDVYPTHLIGFRGNPRRGCEELDVFLCLYPDSASWTGESRTKTQYAQMPQYGEDANFVLAHTMIVRLLDKAKQLGILETVTDDSRFWQHRNPRKLAQTGVNWNLVKSEIAQILEQFPNVKKDFWE